jgi:hypothetical protein
MNLKIAFAGATLFCLANYPAVAQLQTKLDLVQPKMREFIGIADQSLRQGNYNKAIAYTGLILIEGEIKYSIDLSLIPDGDRARATESTNRAIQIWEESLGNEIKFIPVDRSKAQLRIQFKEQVRTRGNEIAGYAVWQRNVHDWGNGIYRASLSGDIDLRTKTPTGRDMSTDAMTHAAAHEIGHLLGLWDSPTFGDIMGPLHLKQPITKLSSNELNALRDARDEARQILQSCHMSQTSLAPRRVAR